MIDKKKDCRKFLLPCSRSIPVDSGEGIVENYLPTRCPAKGSQWGENSILGRLGAHPWG